MGRKTQAAFVAGGTALGLLGAGVAFAAIPNSGVISGCYAKSGGTLRVIDSTTGSCSAKETSLSWNQQGVPGPTGSPGAVGPSGPPGPAGTSATRMFALWGSSAVRGSSGFPEAGIAQQSGGITAGSVQWDKPFDGYLQIDLTFPQDLSACVAVVGAASPNGGFTGISDLQPHVASIEGTTLHVYTRRPASGIMQGFAVSVTC